MPGDGGVDGLSTLKFLVAFFALKEPGKIIYVERVVGMCTSGVYLSCEGSRGMKVARCRGRSENFSSACIPPSFCRRESRMTMI